MISQARLEALAAQVAAQIVAVGLPRRMAHRPAVEAWALNRARNIVSGLIPELAHDPVALPPREEPDYTTEVIK